MRIFPFLILVLVLVGCESSVAPAKVLPVTKEVSIDQLISEDQYNVALLVIPGTYNTELTAPMDIFQHTVYRDGIKSMNVFTVSNTSEPIKTFEGLTVIPDVDFTQTDIASEIDILVIPAAEHNLDSDLENEELLQFIQQVDAVSEYTISHCDGAFMLAKAGVLENRVSTTFPGDVASYKQMFPYLDVRDSVLFVHDGKYITSAGGAKSFEASLYLCELLYGKAKADELSKGMVIDWQLDELNYVVIEN